MNGRKHTAWLVAALVAAIVLATAAPALAATSGTVYGTAQLQFYAITLSGAGLDSGDPLTYVGAPGDKVSEKSSAKVTITNSGTERESFGIIQEQAPTNGSDTWLLAQYGGSGLAAWALNDGTNDYYVSTNPETFAFDVDPGDSIQYDSSFEFPESISDLGDHSMRATVSLLTP